MFTRHKFLLVTVKECLKSVLNYRSYPKNKSGYPFLDHPVVSSSIHHHQHHDHYYCSLLNRRSPSSLFFFRRDGCILHLKMMFLNMQMEECENVRFSTIFCVVSTEYRPFLHEMVYVRVVLQAAAINCSDANRDACGIYKIHGSR